MGERRSNKLNSGGNSERSSKLLPVHPTPDCLYTVQEEGQTPAQLPCVRITIYLNIYFLLFPLMV